jgi:hypothetical protein
LRTGILQRCHSGRLTTPYVHATADRFDRTEKHCIGDVFCLCRTSRSSFMTFAPLPLTPSVLPSRL